MNTLPLWIATLFCLLFTVHTVQAQQTFVVNSADDLSDGFIGNGVCLTVQGTCTLRAAMEEANATPNGATPDVIVFDDIPLFQGLGLIDIIWGELPVISDPVIIDATSAPGEVIINGSNTYLHGIVFSFNSDGSELRGLTIVDFLLDGIQAAFTSNIVIENNYIGVTRDGVSIGNGRYGILVNADNLRIGGIGKGNVIGNNLGGIFLAQGEGHFIRGNYIGTTPDYLDEGNENNGITVFPSASAIIGGPTRAHGNIIGNNGQEGIRLSTESEVIVRNNFIGTNEDGEDLGNELGIYIDSSNHLIGGKKQHGNVIGHNDIGIQVWGDYNRIKGNYIGVTEDGQAISNNIGIHLTGFSNGPTNVTAYYNQVGYQPEASIDPQAENANTIAHNNNEGILAQEVVGSVNLPLYNSIRGNHIYDNGGSGIDLYGTPGSDANDTIDGDIGANFLLNYPDIVRVDYNASFDAIGIEYSISSSPAIVNYPLTVDAYLADDPASGEGKTYIGSSTYTTQNSIQLLAIDASSITWSPTDVIVLTTTDGDGNTSEFSLASAEIGGPGHTVSAFNESARPALKTSNPFTLSAPYPNPFRHQSTFTITTDEEGPIRIALFDILGREVRALFEGNLQKGSPASFSIESQNLPNGTYWIRAETSHRSLVRSVILSR